MTLPYDFLTLSKKTLHIYETIFCQPLCKKFQINQSELDLLLFLNNNPTLNTARDACDVRGLKKGIVSVTTERLVSDGFLVRENDATDRRIQRLVLTEKSHPIVKEGCAIQSNFFRTLLSGLTEEEILLYKEMNGKIRDKILELEKGV